MNLSTTTGFILSIVIFAGTLYYSFNDPSTIVDPRSLMIVVGGSLAATLVSFPASKIFKLLKVFVKRMLGTNKIDYDAIISQLIELAQAKRRGPQAFKNEVDKISYPFLKESCDVLFWLKADISEEEIIKTLVIRARTHAKRYMDEANIFRTIAKFPPAFGLMGTTVGMVSLLQSLGDKGNQAKLGTAMAMALLTTLYGVAIANFILIPIAENLSNQSKDDEIARRMVIEGIILIHQQKNPKFVAEHLQSFILPSERSNNAA